MSADSERRSPMAARPAAIANRLVQISEIVIVAAAGVLVIAAIALAAVTMFELFIAGVAHGMGSIQSVDELQTAVQKVFAGALLLLLGLELLETLRSYFTDFQLKIEIILIVALIAIGRHIMLIDVAHASGGELVGAAALTLALALSYRVVRSSRDKAKD
jgi:uncharacterized membrane protein (DUF373 family)